MAAALLLLLCAFALLPAPTHTATPEPLQALRFHRPAPHHNSTQVSAYASPRGDLAASLGLPGRDLRYLDPKRPSVTQLAARRSCLLLSVGHVRAVVLPDALLLFDRDRPELEGVVPALVHALNQFGRGVLPFEHRALQALLQCVGNRNLARLGALEPAVAGCMAALRSSTQKRMLDELLPLKNALDELHYDLDEVCALLTELVDDDDEMAQFCWPKEAKAGGGGGGREARLELEMMLEHHLSQHEAMRARSADLKVREGVAVAVAVRPVRRPRPP